MITIKWIVASAIISVGALTGCATTEKYDAMLKSWVGHPIGDYIAANGYTPSQVIDEANGKIYVFNVSSHGMYQMPTTTTANVYGTGNMAYGSATTSGGMLVPINYDCTWTFRTNESGNIYQYSWRGNSCRQK